MPGSWEPQLPFGPFANGSESICAIHALHWFNPEFGGSGRILAMDGGVNIPFTSPFARLFDPLMPPASGPEPFQFAHQRMPNDRTNLFCSGHCR